MKWLLIPLSVVVLTGCATRPKTYQPPSDARVRAAERDLNVKVDRARETAGKAKVVTEEAHESAKRLIELAKTTSDKLKVLRGQIPAEFRPLADEVKTALDAQTSEETVTRDKTNSAVGWNAQLAVQLQEAETARVTLLTANEAYVAGAVALAQDATNERNARIVAEKQLIRQRIYSILWKVGGGAVVLLIIVLFVLWFTGKLAFKFAK